MPADAAKTHAADIFTGHVAGIEEALKLGADGATLEDVIRAIVNRRAQVWGDKKALIVTELGSPSHPEPTINLWVATGELDALIDLSREILEWATEIGYERATLTGRRGWIRALKDEGWQQRAVVMERRLHG